MRRVKSSAGRVGEQRGALSPGSCTPVSLRSMSIIHWFRRDLRLTDNAALLAAAEAAQGAVIPVFILDDAVLGGRDIAPARVQFLLDCLRDLEASLNALGSRLIVRRGDPVVELAQIARESGASGVFSIATTRRSPAGATSARRRRCARPGLASSRSRIR